MGTLITNELGAATEVWCMYRSFNSAIIGKYKKHIGISETEERVVRQAFTAISALVGSPRGMCTGSCNLKTSLAEVHEI